jgi:hypothetical protein
MEPPRLEFRDEHLGPVRRFMSGDPDGLAALDQEDDERMSMGLLFHAAFMVAVRRHFGGDGPVISP